MVKAKGRMIKVKVLVEKDHKTIDLKETQTSRMPKEKLVQEDHLEEVEVMEKVEIQWKEQWTNQVLQLQLDRSLHKQAS